MVPGVTKEVVTLSLTREELGSLISVVAWHRIWHHVQPVEPHEREVLARSLARLKAALEVRS